jgi:hypothetical protein
MGWHDRSRRDKILIGMNATPRVPVDNKTNLDSVTLFIDAALTTDVIL